MAWPSATHLSFILSIIYLKGSSGQQNGLINQANTNIPLGSPLPSSPILQKTLNQIPRCPLHQKLLNGQIGGNLPPPMNLQQLNLQQAALQQQFNLQQAANMPQVPNLQSGVNFPQANIPQMNMPPNVNQLNLQQPGNLYQFNGQQPGNFQQLQQPTPNLSLNIQPNNLQSNLSPNFANNIPFSNNLVPDITLASSPLLNQVSGVSSQITQQYHDPGLISSMAPSIPYSLNFNPGAQTVPMGYPTNQQIPLTNVPSSVIDLSQVANPTGFGAPVSELGTINNQQYALVALPVQNSRAVNIQPNVPNSMQGLPNQVTVIKSVQPQGYFDPTKSSLDLDQKLSLISSLMSDSSPNQYQPGSLLNGNSILGAALSKAGSKSSNLQALLPLIFNLLKEKNSGCSCHHCGCTNNKQEPQLSSGYSNKNNYSHETTSGRSKNNDEEKNKDEEIEETTVSPKPKSLEVKKKSQKENKINNTDSSEYESDSDYIDNYDDEE